MYKASSESLLNRKVNHIANETFAKMPRDNWFLNNLITIRGTRRPQEVFLLPLPSVKGKT